MNRKLKKRIKRVLAPITKRNSFIRKNYRKFMRAKRKRNYIKNHMYIQTEEKTVLFESYQGRSFGCSPKAIFLKMFNDDEYSDYKFIWIFRKRQKYLELFELEGLLDGRVEVVKCNTKAHRDAFARSKYFIVNTRIPNYIEKKPEQYYVQCWHGTPLKRLGHDIIPDTKAANNSHDELLAMNDRDAIRYDYFLSPSKFASDKFISSFNLKQLNKENTILEKGYPRNDYLFNYRTEDISRIKEKYGIPEDKKIILYAPTWRDDQHKAGEGYTYKTEADFDYLRDELSNDYVILFRAHYYIANKFDFEKYENFVIDVSAVDDINELYVVSDILITDYSSVFFDYANLKRPIIFFMYDLKHYMRNLRGFYFGLEELPGKIVKEEKDVIKIINNLDKYELDNEKKYSDFNKKFTYLDDGKASERVIKTLFKE